MIILPLEKKLHDEFNFLKINSLEKINYKEVLPHPLLKQLINRNENNSIIDTFYGSKKMFMPSHAIECAIIDENIYIVDGHNRYNLFVSAVKKYNLDENIYLYIHRGWTIKKLFSRYVSVNLKHLSFPDPRSIYKSLKNISLGEIKSSGMSKTYFLKCLYMQSIRTTERLLFIKKQFDKNKGIILWSIKKPN